VAQEFRAVLSFRSLNGFRLMFTAVLALAAGPGSSEPGSLPPTISTQIETDGSLSGTAEVIMPDPWDSNRYTIGEDHGLLVGEDPSGVGGNLFYSFGQFDLANTDTAVFSGASGLGSASPGALVVRVTNGSPSYLYGAIESEFSDTDFFFANRAGIIVGPSGSFDLSGISNSPGSFFMSSADRLIFDDGFFSTGGNGPAFQPDVPGLDCCGGDPSAFDFDHGGAGEVLFNGGFHEWEGEGIVQIAAGDIRLIEGGTFINKGGEFHLSAVGTAALTVPVAGAGDAHFSGTATPNGVIELLRAPGGSGTLELSANSGATSNGRIVLRGGRLVFDRAAIRAGGRDGSEPTIDIEAWGSIVLEGSTVDAVATSEPSSPDHTGVRIAGADILLSEAVIIGTNSSGEVSESRKGSKIASTSWFQSAGRVELLATGSLALEGQRTRIETAVKDAPGGGDIRISARSLELRDGAQVLAAARRRGDPTGPVGDIGVVAEELLLENGSTIGSFTESLSAGGSVVVDVGGRLALLDASEIYTESLGDPSLLTGEVGDVLISAGEIVLADRSSIRSTTQTAAPGGDVDLMANGSIRLSTLSAIASEPRGFGDAGDIRIRGGSLLLEGGSQVISQSNPDWILDVEGNLIKEASLEMGAPGDIAVVVAGALEIDGVYGTGVEDATRSMISARVENPGSEADAGNIAITGGSVEIKNGALVTSRNSSDVSAGIGRAGSISVTATDSFIRLAGRAPLSPDPFGRTIDSEISARSSGAAAGDIRLEAPNVEISGGAGVAATSFGLSRAGSISIEAGEEILLVNSRITAKAGRTDGGNISLDAGELIEVVDSLIETEVLADQGGAGEIMVGQQVEPSLVLLNSSALISNAAQGGAGDISISGGRLIRSADTVVQAASDNEQLNGEISIDALEEELTGRLVPLEIAYLDVNSLLLPPCAARLEADRSSLTVRGRPGMASEPGGLLPSPILSAADGQGASSERLARGRGISVARGTEGQGILLGSLPPLPGSVGSTSCGADWPWPEAP
jgi:filamentous hemagglutinin family protein